MVCWLISIEDWDAIVASLGPESRGAASERCKPEINAHVGADKQSKGGSLGPTYRSCLCGEKSGPSRFDRLPDVKKLMTNMANMENERLRLERLGRQIAFYLGTSLLVVILATAILGGLRW